VATEQYSIGYEEGFQNGWNAAVDSLPTQRKPLTPSEVHGMAEAHGIDGDARHWYVVGLMDAQAKHNIKENT